MSRDAGLSHRAVPCFETAVKTASPAMRQPYAIALRRGDSAAPTPRLETISRLMRLNAFLCAFCVCSVCSVFFKAKAIAGFLALLSFRRLAG